MLYIYHPRPTFGSKGVMCKFVLRLDHVEQEVMCSNSYSLQTCLGLRVKSARMPPSLHGLLDPYIMTTGPRSTHINTRKLL